MIDREPGMGLGNPASDQVMIGPQGNQEPFISRAHTQALGDSIKKTIGGAAGGLQRGRGIRYHTVIATDKVTTRTMSQFVQASAAGRSAQAEVEQTVRREMGMDVARGTAKASFGKAGGLRAVPNWVGAIVNDPIEFEFANVSPGDGATIDVSIGHEAELLEMQVSELGEFAKVLLEIGGKNEGESSYTTFVSMAIHLDFMT